MEHTEKSGKEIKSKYLKPLVVIRCITYNHEPYIRDALEGFVMQKTDFPFVAIVHDDASTDGTASIIREYAEKYPDIIKPIYETENQYSKHDGSLGKIMNEACKATGAKYIAMCEGDDYWTDPLKLQKQVDFLESHPDYGVVYTNFRGFRQKSKEYIDMHITPHNGYQYERMLREQLNIWTLTICFRSELLKHIPSLSPVKFFTGDRLWFLTFTSRTKVYCLNEITSVYRILEESASHFKDEKKTVIFKAKALMTHNYMMENGPEVSRGTWCFVKGRVARALIAQAYKCNQQELLKEVKYPFRSIKSMRDFLMYILLIGRNKYAYNIIKRMI
jgi:glycosyltransferase